LRGSRLLPVLEEATESKGNKLEDRLQHKYDSENVVADLQSLIQDLLKQRSCKENVTVKVQKWTNIFLLLQNN